LMPQVGKICGPSHSDLPSDEQQYLASPAILINLKADLPLEGHFGVIETQPECSNSLSIADPRLHHHVRVSPTNDLSLKHLG
jgi:hypothetical protein